MNLSSYLVKRPNSQNWHLRKMIPKAARPLVGKAEFTKSLGVTDRKEAERLAYLQLTKWEAQIAAAVSGTVEANVNLAYQEATVEQLNDILASDVFEIDKHVHRYLSREIAKSGANAFADEKAFLRSMVANWRQQIFVDDFTMFAWRAEEVVAGNGLSFPDEETRRDFVRRFAQTQCDAVSAVISKMDGRDSEFQPSPFIVAALDRKTRLAKQGETISELFDLYAKQRKAEGRKRLDTINQDRIVVERFAAFVGEKRSLRSIEPADIRDWRDTVAALPANYRKMNAYAGLSMRQAAAKAKAIGGARVSATTINKYLSTVSPVFSWAVRNAYADRNPCIGLFYDIVKGKNPRPPFSTEQLNKILGSPLFTGFLREGREHLSGDERADDWRYWIPLVCLFTGARIGEIAQLHIDDVEQADGIWFLHIRNDTETGQSTKSGHSRVAPVHSVLQSIGFLNFYERQRDRASRDGNRQLFPELTPNKRGQIGGIPSRFWRGYLSSIGVKDGGDGIGAHSFRHTIADQLRLADYLDDEIEVALGHNQKSVTSGYGKVKQGTVNKLSEMFARLKFEGINLSHLLLSTEPKIG